MDRPVGNTPADLVARLRKRLMCIPKPGTSPRQIANGESITMMMGGDPKAGDEAGERYLPNFSVTAYGPQYVQPHVWAVDPLCEEAAKEIEGYQAWARSVNEALNSGDGSYRP